MVAISTAIGVLKGFVSLAMVAMEMGKKEIFGYHSNSCKEGNMLHQKTWIFYIRTTTDKIELTGKVQVKKNAAISKSYIFSKRVLKLKNIVSFHDYCHNFVIEIETG